MDDVSVLLGNSDVNVFVNPLRACFSNKFFLKQLVLSSSLASGKHKNKAGIATEWPYIKQPVKGMTHASLIKHSPCPMLCKSPVRVIQSKLCPLWLALLVRKPSVRLLDHRYIINTKIKLGVVLCEARLS